MFDISLHLFVDGHHIRANFGLHREFGKLEKHPEPVLEDIPGRLVFWSCVLRSGRTEGTRCAIGPFTGLVPTTWERRGARNKDSGGADFQTVDGKTHFNSMLSHLEDK